MARQCFSVLVFRNPVSGWQALARRILHCHHQTMFGAFLGPFSILIVKAISATVPHPSQSSIALSDSSAVDSLPLFLGNASSDDPASGNALEITCDHILGSGFRVSSCRTLFPLMKKGTDEVVFADRTSPLHHDINLPFRVQSRKLLECQTRCKALSDWEL